MIIIMNIKPRILKLATSASLIVVSLITALSLAGGVASAIASNDHANTNAAASTATSTTQQQHLQNIISRGNEEISRRLTSLNTLASKITSATHLTSSDAAVLSAEVSSAISGLQTLQTQLDASTSLSSAITYAKDIFTEYRVYAIVMPKIQLIKMADDQQAVQAKLSTMAQKLQARLTAEQQAGQNVASLLADLANMNSEIKAAAAISASVEAAVINVEPTDFNSNHSVLEGYNTQLKTAHTDDQAAFNDVKTIVNALKSLKS